MNGVPMAARVTISLPEELLEKLDAEAGSLGTSRSFLVQEATANYLGRSVEQRLDDQRRARVLDAIEGMRRMAERSRVLDGRPTLEILREIRETDDSAPLRGVGQDT
jgi:metal-responsive CopG/Arc/MetJ family transcriptional regulator